MKIKIDRTGGRLQGEAADDPMDPAGTARPSVKTYSFLWERFFGLRSRADLNLDFQDISRQQYRLLSTGSAAPKSRSKSIWKQHNFTALYYPVRQKMIPIGWSKEIPIPNLSQIQENHQRYGGRIVLFMRVTSYIVLCRSVTLPIWIGPGKSVVWPGVVASMRSIALGIWSLPGIPRTLGALIYNLSGGCDVTKLIGYLPLVPGTAEHTAELTRIQRWKNRQFFAQVATFLSLILIAVAFLIWRDWDNVRANFR